MAAMLCEWQGAVMHDENPIKAGARWLNGVAVALLSVARCHCLVLPGAGAKPLL